MKNMLIASMLVGAAMLAGCDDKQAASSVDKVKDSASKAAGTMKEAGTKAAESAKGAVDAASTKVMDEVKGMVDTAKTKLEALTKGGASLTADKKAEFDKMLPDLSAQLKSLTDSFGGLKDLSGEGLMKKLTDLKGSGTKLMDGIKAAADKFGIKI